MHNISPKAPLRLPRFNSLTGRKRRSWAALAGGIALALFLGSGIAVAAVSSVEAHNADYKVSCSAITVNATYYNTSKGMNTIEVSIGDAAPSVVTFAESAHPSFPTGDSTVAHPYTIKITAADDPRYSFTWSGTTTPCVAPLITASASACTVAGSATALDVSVDRLVAGREYSVEVLRNGGSVGTFPITPTQAVWKSAGSTLPTWWSTLEAGATFTVKVTDTTDSTLFATADAVSLACPVSPNVNISATQCLAPGQQGSVTLTANVVEGRTYEVNVYKGGTVFETLTPTGDGSGVFSKTYAADASSTWYFTIKDVGAGTKAEESAHVTLLPCPGLPVKPTLVTTPCTVTDGTADSTLGITAGGLVPGRSYTITLFNGSTTVEVARLAPANASEWSSKPALALPPGTYTVTVTDISDPNVTTLSATETATIIVCPTDQTVTVVPTQCAVPGGSGSIDASVTGYAAGRTYTVTLTRNGVAVGAPQEFVAPTDPAKPAVPFSFTGLAPDSYRVIVVDKLLPSKIAAGDVVLADCPGNPEPIVTQGTCSVLTGASTIKVDLSKLVVGETYTVTISAPGATPQQVVATASTASVSFTKVPNAKPYTVTVANAANTLTATAKITPKVCDLPTFSLPFDPPTLAYTGSSTTLPGIAALVLLQLGLVLLGISLVRRRATQA